ncbi:MAG: histidine kinase, partial [Alteromonadaceae bacterium]|nr:histidine kinase [Alteromonadaceae bacterium]
MPHLRLSYQTVEFGETDIHLCTLRNNQEFYDPDLIAEKLGISSASWPIFGIVWPSGIVLAHFMNNYDTQAKRILEVGCGMALSSLLLNK